MSAYDSAVDKSGNTYVTGDFYGEVDFDPGDGVDIHSSHTNNYSDSYLSKFDSSGKFLWTRTWGDGMVAIGYSVIIDDSGDIYVAGFLGYSRFRSRVRESIFIRDTWSQMMFT